jgi:formate dehydrogenase major subunit
MEISEAWPKNSALKTAEGQGGIRSGGDRLSPWSPTSQALPGRWKNRHEVGIPFNYGWRWRKGGDASANYLTPPWVCPNTFCPEYKAFMVNIKKA